MSDPMVSLLGLISGLVLGFSAGWLDRRLRAADLRISELKSARMMLDRYYKALAVLDDEDAPAEILDLASRLARLIQNPLTPKAIAYVLSVNPKAFLTRKSENKEKWVEIIKNTRPDLLEAFATSNAAGIAAFVGRWPECRGAFDDILVELAASPVHEAENVLDVTNKALSYLNVSGAVLAH